MDPSYWRWYHQIHSIITTALDTIVFGRSTQSFFDILRTDTNEVNSVLGVLQEPAITIHY